MRHSGHRVRVFFDDYPLFYDSDSTAAHPRRLNLRHRAIIESNRDILQGARVLDLASHDGRWSFAALKAGAAHAIGVEAREQLVDKAGKTFAEYGMPTDRYEFIRGDLFRVLETKSFEVDVVLCLGFVYHTLRYGELFRGIRATRARHCILDSRVVLGHEPLVHLKVNRTTAQGNAAEDALSSGQQALAGWPSVPALELMLGVYDIDVAQRFDWPSLMASEGVRVHGYEKGERVTLRCRVGASRT